MNVSRFEELCRDLLVEIGEDPDREGLKGTPARFAQFWREFIDYDSGNMETTFQSITADQLVIVSGMKIWSLCEHHLMPFWCSVSIGYLAGDRVLGLSKFARIAHSVSHRLQVQERITHQIAEEVKRLTGSPHVAVHLSGVHSCMIMRGIKTEGEMQTSVMNGDFREEPTLRAEFLSLIR
jgi:GTP cyclohydrolase I